MTEMTKVLLIRVISAAVSLSSVAYMSASPTTCGMQVIPQRDSSNSPQPASVTISGNGRFLAFSSYAPLLPADTNERSDVYVFDMTTKKLTIESILPDGSSANTDSFRPDISDDGRLVVFQSSGRLVSTNGEEFTEQVILRDRHLGTTTVLSANRAGERGNNRSAHAVISSDGRVVAFESAATNLVPGADANGPAPDVYAVIVATRDVVRVSVTSTSRQLAEGSSFGPSISADGDLIAFTASARLDEDRAQPRATRRNSRAEKALPLQLNAELRNVFVRDLARGTTRRISRTDRGDPNGSSYLPAISDDGRWIAFVSNATDLVANDKNGASDVFLYDLRTSTTSLVSRSVSGGTANGASTRPVISADGELVAFESDASDLVCSSRCATRDQDVNLLSDVFVSDRARGVATRLSADAEGGWMQPSRSPAIAGNGEVIVFSSRRPTDDRDRGDDFDLFVAVGCSPPTGSTGQ